MIPLRSGTCSTQFACAITFLIDWTSTSLFAEATTSCDLGMSVLRGPQYGWYSEFDPWPEVRRRPRELLLPSRPRRAQARHCIKTARKWKRRRFVQALRMGRSA